MAKNNGSINNKIKENQHSTSTMNMPNNVCVWKIRKYSITQDRFIKNSHI